MSNTEVIFSKLSDLELDAVAAGNHRSSRQVAVGNFALQIARNDQVNVSYKSSGAGQGGNQSNVNNAGNISG